MVNFVLSLLLKIRKKSSGFRLIWVLSAVVLALFGSDFSPILGSNWVEAEFVGTQNLSVGHSQNSWQQSELTVLPRAEESSTQLAQVSTSSVKGQVRALTTVILPAIYLESGLQVAGQILSCGGCYGSFWYAPHSPVGLGQWTGYMTGDSFYPKTFLQNATAIFDLTALPIGQTVIAAEVVFGLGCSGARTTTITPYYTTGLTDPRDVSRVDWRVLYASGGLPILATANGCSPGAVMLDGVGSSQIQSAKSSVNRYALSFSGGGTFASFSNPQLRVTYGNREVILKVNGSDGPITVTAGSNVNFSWSTVGYTSCNYGSVPAWYTNGWESGRSVPSAGSTSTKIYYENVTYVMTCKDAGSGATGSDSVTVNVVS